MTKLQNLCVLSLFALASCAADVSNGFGADDVAPTAPAVAPAADVEADAATPVEPQQQPETIAQPPKPEPTPEPQPTPAPAPAVESPAPAAQPVQPSAAPQPEPQPTPAAPVPESTTPTKCRINAGQTYGGQVVECGGHWQQYFPGWLLTWSSVDGKATYTCNEPPAQCVKGAPCEWLEISSGKIQRGVCQ